MELPPKKTYADLGDACATAHALDVVGDRWSLIIARELMLGPRRFGDLQSAVVGITPAVLTDRLRHLADAGVVEQVTLDDLARTRAYRLTPWGSGLEAVMAALGRWAHASAGFPVAGAGMTPDGAIVAMRTMTPPSPQAPRPVELGLELVDVRRPAAGVRRYRLRWRRRSFELVEGTVEAPDATVTGDSTAWTAAVFGMAPLDALEHDGALSVTGDRAALAAVLELYRGVAAELA
ncbi:transcriptional regulator, HxlR family [Nocardioides terrae]|uniref:Transcriptional regulator, HxlR family n=1 Tax=Nocardioides terrae TaxID=574651 RepID=A0A1I1GSC3_9ACTN|nr:winged helix-turn-helix transcriptional regulator [Nocardioides terrae]SFC14687.1 transcriptional regulator, HxlR family [Nocardioides terrae]